jgi:hypothetical protein
MSEHRYLDDAGQQDHWDIDHLLSRLRTAAENLPKNVSGARDDTEEALANLLAALETLGLITDNTTAS